MIYKESKKHFSCLHFATICSLSVRQEINAVQTSQKGFFKSPLISEWSNHIFSTFRQSFFCTEILFDSSYITTPSSPVFQTSSPARCIYSIFTRNNRQKRAQSSPRQTNKQTTNNSCIFFPFFLHCDVFHHLTHYPHEETNYSFGFMPHDADDAFISTSI